MSSGQAKLSEPPPEGQGSGDRELSRSLLFLFSLTAAVAVANIYYAQPLLNEIRTAFGVSEAAAGLLVTLGQLGYLIGLAFIVPAGDRFERRRLIVSVLAISGLVASSAALAPSLSTLAVALVLLGSLSVITQVIVPLAAILASIEERGRAVGTVTGGALVGILLARTFSGLVASVASWRAVYAIAAALMIALSFLLMRSLPPVPPESGESYRNVLRSVITLVRRLPPLRIRMAIGFLIFTCFSAMWTSLTFLLGSSRYGYSESVIGLFGLAGLAGVAAAPLSGRLVDLGRGRLAIVTFLVGLIVSWPLLALGQGTLVALLGGVVLLDLAVQAAHINNQSSIYALLENSASRITTAYLVSVFLGMTVGSAVSSEIYSLWGWTAVCGFGCAIACAALASGLVDRGATGVGARPDQPGE